MSATVLTVTATINKPAQQVWELWTEPEHIKKWNNASPDWHTPHATNDLKVGGKFVSTMAAKDGSMSFDFWGTYNNIIVHELIESTMGDGRMLNVQFIGKDSQTEIIEKFEAETQNSIELQQAGWQAILNNFKAYAESL